MNRLWSTISRLLIIGSPLLLNDFYLRLLPKDGSHELRLVLDIIFYIAFQTILIYTFHQAGWFSWRAIGMRFDHLAKQLWMGAALTSIVFGLAFALKAILVVVEKYHGIEMGAGHGDLPQWSVWQVTLLILYWSITAGLYEEVIYRGIVVHELGRLTNNKIVLVVGSSAFFGLIHWSLGLQIISMAFMLGLFWAVLYMRTGYLLPNIIAHFIFDFVTFSQWHLPAVDWLHKTL